MSSFDYSTEITQDEITGQYYITIPYDLVEDLGWGEGDVVEWEYHDYNEEPGLRLHRVGE